jgi:hypothetical protein
MKAYEETICNTASAQSPWPFGLAAAPTIGSRAFWYPEQFLKLLEQSNGAPPR